MKYKKTLAFFLLLSALFIFAREFVKEISLFRGPYEEKWESSCSSSVLEGLCSKPLSFLGMGSQCLVFSHENSPYVFKVCKANRYQPPSILDTPPISLFTHSYKERKRARKIHNKENDFTSYFIAHSKLQNQTGIVFLHLNKTSTLKTAICLIDPLGIKHTFNCDDLIFYVQYKATSLPSYLATATNKEAELFFTTLFDMVLENCKQGINIKDSNPEKNIGVYEGSPLWIDPGRIIQDPTLCSFEGKKSYLENFYHELTPLFSNLNPELLIELERIFKQKIAAE